MINQMLSEWQEQSQANDLGDGWNPNQQELSGVEQSTTVVDEEKR